MRGIRVEGWRIITTVVAVSFRDECGSRGGCAGASGVVG